MSDYEDDPIPDKCDANVNDRRRKPTSFAGMYVMLLEPCLT